MLWRAALNFQKHAVCPQAYWLQVRHHGCQRAGINIISLSIDNCFPTRAALTVVVEHLTNGTLFPIAFHFLFLSVFLFFVNITN